MTRKAILSFTLIVLIGCSLNSKKNSLTEEETDSVESIISSQKGTIDSLETTLKLSEKITPDQKKEYNIQNKNLTKSAYEDIKQLKNCKCNLEYVLLARQSIDSLTETAILGLLCTFDDSCVNNAEYEEFSNNTLHEIINSNPELFISTLFKYYNQLDTTGILHTISAPLTDIVNQDTYNTITNIYGFEPIKQQVVKSYKMALRSAGIDFYDTSDCIFDTSTQTDEFLKGIPELSTYEWNQSITTARLVLEEGDTLYISRGGCNHFGINVEFHLKSTSIKDPTLEKAFDKVLWIAHLLKKEFYYDELEKAIKLHNYEREENGNLIYVTFKEQNLMNNNYEVTFKNDGKRIIISLSFYIN